MKLLIISHTEHYQKGNSIVGWGPTIREINYLASLFDEVTHIATMHPGDAPNSCLPYTSGNVNFVGVPPVGGKTLSHKFTNLRYLWKYLKIIMLEMNQCDVVHVRAPAFISFLAILLLTVRKSPKYRWVKYAGNWKPTGKEALSYTIQRWILQHNLHRGVVTVNGQWKDQPEHIYSFLNPCLKDDELMGDADPAYNRKISPPYQLLFVGRIEAAKGVPVVLHIAANLRNANIDFQLHLIGDGPQRSEFEALADELGIGDQTHFWGWLPRTALTDHYRNAHFMLLPSVGEGWPKVLSEAMSQGAVILASTVSSIPQILEQTGAGFAIPADDIHAYTKKIADLIDKSEQWSELSRSGMRNAAQFSYDQYLNAVKNMMEHAWGICVGKGGFL